MILPLEAQVTSLELSKNLKELKVRQDSLFYWVPGTFESGYEGEYWFRESDEWALHYGEVGLYDFEIKENGPDIYLKSMEKRKKLSGKVCAAFTSSELGEMLLLPSIEILKLSKMWYIRAHAESYSSCLEVDARAKMLIYLIENKLINLGKEG